MDLKRVSIVRWITLFVSSVKVFYLYLSRVELIILWSFVCSRCNILFLSTNSPYSSDTGKLLACRPVIGRLVVPYNMIAPWIFHLFEIRMRLFVELSQRRPFKHCVKQMSVHYKWYLCGCFWRNSLFGYECEMSMLIRKHVSIISPFQVCRLIGREIGVIHR